MVAVRPGEAEAVLSRIDPLRPVVLLFGPDSGLVRERGKAYLARAGAGSDDPFGLVRLDGDEIASQPHRLIEEASTVALFGGRRVISLRAGAKNIVPAVEPVLAAPLTDAVIVIEAGDLKKGAPLRALCESSQRASAIACYPDTERDIARVVDAMLAEAGLAIDRDARADLLGLLGGDRLASRGEVTKLILYAQGDGRVTSAHIRAIVGDASSLALDDISDAALAGNGRDAAGAFGRALGEGIRPDAVLGATTRSAQALHALRLVVEGGASIERAIEAARPGIHFRRKPLVETALRSWTSTRLGAAFVTLDEALLAARRNAQLAPAIAERALLGLASAARRS